MVDVQRKGRRFNERGKEGVERGLRVIRRKKE